MNRITAVAIALTAACAHLTPALEMEVLFRDTRGLAVGSEVRLRDTRIGEVRSLEKRGDDVAVGIVVEERHRDRITTHTTFQVKKVGLFSSDRYVAVEPGAGTRVSDGTSVRGQESLTDRIAGWVKQTAGWLTNDELRAQVSDFEAAVRDAAARGTDAFEDARPELEEQAERLVELARDHGPDVADKMQEVLDEILAAAAER